MCAQQTPGWRSSSGADAGLLRRCPRFAVMHSPPGNVPPHFPRHVLLPPGKRHNTVQPFSPCPPRPPRPIHPPAASPAPLPASPAAAAAAGRRRRRHAGEGPWRRPAAPACTARRATPAAPPPRRARWPAGRCWWQRAEGPSAASRCCRACSAEQAQSAWAEMESEECSSGAAAWPALAHAAAPCLHLLPARRPSSTSVFHVCQPQETCRHRCPLPRPCTWAPPRQCPAACRRCL